jgi:hypothetical protein
MYRWFWTFRKKEGINYFYKAKPEFALFGDINTIILLKVATNCLD